MPVYTLHRYYGVYFDRPPIPPRSGQEFENGCDDFTGCYGLLLDHFYFPRRLGLLYHICEGKGRFGKAILGLIIIPF